MKIKIAAILGLLLLTAFVSLRADRQQEKRIYLFGVAKNYTDSVSIMTDIFTFDNVVTNGKDGAVANLEMYTEQLNQYFKEQGKRGYICATFFSDKYKDIEKQYVKLRRRFAKEKNLELRTVNNSEFQYVFVDSKQIYQNTVSDTSE